MPERKLPQIGTKALKAKWETYRGFLRSGEAKQILDAYKERGGDPDRLRGVLWELRECQYHKGLPSAPARKALQHSATSLHSLCEYPEIRNELPDVWESAQATLGEIENTLAYFTFKKKVDTVLQDLTRMTAPLRNDGYFSLPAASLYTGLSVKTLRIRLTDREHPLPHSRVNGKTLLRRSEVDHWLRGLRRKGRYHTTLVAAVLVEEFRQRFGRSNYEWALTLLHEAAPNVFKLGTYEGHGAEELRGLVRRVEKDVVTRLHANIFS